jgi:chromosome transmission fidelity protein 1
MKLESTEVNRKPEYESQFELDEYKSDNDNEKRSAARGTTDVDGLSANTLALLDRFKGHFSAENAQSQTDDNDIQIFYCSRTHSQLTQFVNELNRVKLSPSLPRQQSVLDNYVKVGNEDIDLDEGIKHLSLGSRKALCINSTVLSLGNATAINERCLDLQKPGIAAERKCPYLPSGENEAVLLDFRDHTLAAVRDIEDTAKVGKQLGICPYYASRSVIKYSEIVTLPYPLLLQRSAREALNLSVKNHVVIIDEAHNLMDTISNIYSVSVTLGQLRTSLSQLTLYAKKYQTRLKGKNRVYITQIIRLINSIADHLQFLLNDRPAVEGVVQHADLMAGKGVDQINLHKLSRYLQESKLARKVDGFVEHCVQKSGQQSKDPATIPVLFHVQSFILSLVNPSAEGRLFFIKEDGGIRLQYLLLDTANHFREIVEDARAVILAGGTMSPVSQGHGASTDNIINRSCL